MAEQDRGSDDPQLAAIARHALHDEELIAAFATDDVEDAADAERARGLVERCAMCHDLHRDLVALRAAIRSSGTAAQRAERLTAPRDFRLTVEDAARLRPGSPVGRIAERLGWRARLNLGVAAFGRPVGATMATFGVVGLLVGSLALGGGPMASLGGAAASSAAPGIDTTGGPAPESTQYRASYGPLATVRDGAVGGGVSGEAGGGLGPGALLLGSSVALVLVGVGLILAARRNPPRVSAPSGN